MTKTVFVGMSGGVDSSVSALLLLEQGYNVIGVYMKNWSEDLPGMKCPWAEDLADAKRVAVKLGIDFEVWDFEKAYREKVVEYMLEEFRKGNTPNPDIMCNQEIKFKLFYEKAMEAGADYIATGHYARVMTRGADFVSAEQARANLEKLPEASTELVIPAQPRRSFKGFARRAANCEQNLPTESSSCLLRAVDENKDQTYFLYRISEEALAHTIFPIGGMLKPEVKKLAAEHGLHNAYKKESMGVCFVGEVGIKDFLKEYIEVEPGEIREIESDRVLGYHEGAVFYTIGQRHGLYLNGEKGVVNDGMPYYVVKKNLDKNIVYVSKNLNHEAIWTKELKLRDMFFRTEPLLGGSAQTESSLGGSCRHMLPPLSLRARAGDPQVASPAHEKLVSAASMANHGHRMSSSSSREAWAEDFQVASPAHEKLSDNNETSRIMVRLRHRAPLVPAEFNGETLYFENEIKRPASGQSAVLYDGEVCLGGGIIA